MARRAITGPAVASQKTATDWRKTAASRRLVLGALILLQTTVATWSLSNTFPYPALKASEIAILLLFAVLFSWISLGFWSAVAGFWMLWRGTNEFTTADLPVDSRQPLRSRTAVLMPICNEDVARVFAGLEASYRSLFQTAQFSSFDFFVLSDTAMTPSGKPKRKSPGHKPAPPCRVSARFFIATGVITSGVRAETSRIFTALGTGLRLHDRL